MASTSASSPSSASNGTSSSSQQKKRVIRLLMIGDSGVGKTSLVLRYDEDSFSHKFVTTIGVDYRDKLVDIDGKPVKLQIWDTAGQERFRSLTANFFSRADGMVLTFDVTNRKTFDHVTTWHDEIKEKAMPGVDIVLCGTKAEPGVERRVTPEEAESLAQSLNLRYFETSAKDDVNVSPMFLGLATMVSRRKAMESASEREARSNVTGFRATAEPAKGACC